METDSLSFVTLIEHLRRTDHLSDLLDEIEPDYMVDLLAKTGLQDARSMVRKPGRLPHYIRANRPRLVSFLAQEEPARDTITAWLTCQLQRMETHPSEEEAKEATEAGQPGSLFENLFKTWVAESAWWKVALATGALHLMEADLVTLEEDEIGQVLEQFDKEFPELLDVILARIRVRTIQQHSQKRLDRLVAESQNTASLLREIAERLEGQEELPDSEEIGALTERLHSIQEMLADVQKDLEEQVAAVSLPAEITPPGQCVTLGDLVRTSTQIRKFMAEWETQQQQAAIQEEISALLQPVLDLSRVDGQDMPELEAVKGQARVLIQAVEDLPMDDALAREIDSIREGTHPLSLLLQVVSGAITGDDALLKADQVLSEAFGRRLAIVAVSGRLAVTTQVPTPEIPKPQIELPPEKPDGAEVPVEPMVAPPSASLMQVEVEPATISEGEPKAIEIVKKTPSPEEQALITEEISPENEWHDLFWDLTRGDDLPAAYWLACGLEAQNKRAPVPSWLLAAVQGAQWLADSRDKIAEDLAGIVQMHELEAIPVQQLLGIAAALVPSIIAPATGMLSWLDGCPLPSLAAVVDVVKAYTNQGYALRQEDLMGVSGQNDLRVALDGVVERARRWIEEAPARRVSFKRANDIWRSWVSSTGELRQILELVVANDPKGVAKVRSLVEEWSRLSTEERIHRADIDQHRRGLKPIVGAARNKLVGEAGEALDLAEEWCDLVERQREIEKRGDRLFRYVQQLVEGVTEKLPEAMADLARLSADRTAGPMAPAAHTTLQALVQLQYRLTHTRPESEADEAWYVQRLDTKRGLWSALASRLLLLPEILLDEEGWPTQDALPLLPICLRDAHREQRTLHDAFEGWLARQDYRFIQPVLALLSGEPDAADLSRRWREAASASQAALREAIQFSMDMIEQAMIDGVITEEQHSELAAELEAAREGEKGQNYRPLLERLKAVQSDVERTRFERSEQQRKRWEAIQARLAVDIADGSARDRIIGFVQEAIDRQDTVLVDERLASLEEALDRGIKPDASQFAPPLPQRDVYQEFLSALPQLEALLNTINLSTIVKAIASNERVDGLQLPRLPKPRVEESIRAIQAWRELKGPRGQNEVSRENAATILQYVGFTFSGYPPAAVEEQQRGRDWAYLQINASASDLSPIPQFGSEQDGHLNVVCLWERPGMDTISARLHDLKLKHGNVLVLYFGRLWERQRLDAVRFARDRRLGIVVLDEILLLFLAREYESRLPVFLRCALPLSYVNPYVATGVVPPEMFFGREEMILPLQSPTGAAIVYGGRQLGKSALLRRVADEFHRPEREQYAIYEDIKLVGDPTSGQPYGKATWHRLRDGLARLGLLDSRAETSETILRRIREGMEASPQRRVLVLFDEADKFLKSDADSGFHVVSDLKRLMDDTRRRFKIVFAGLNNVQRYRSISNQPLAHLEDLLVGPLEARAALHLIREPMEALGFRFEDERTALRILAYTNYHPGLIQLFCRELLNRLLKKRIAALDVYPICQADVEEVYRSEEVRDEIRKRFDWTLALNPRYQAIAWSLVIDQMADRDGYAKAYNLAEVLALGKYWWLQGFAGVESDQIQSILDEMCGLGMLVRNVQGRYRLRSPNLVRLMGSEEDIETRLLELAGRAPDLEAIIADSHRAPLDSAARFYSPFTYAQANILNAPRFGTALIFGSDALGLTCIRDAFRQFIPADLPEDIEGECSEMRFAAMSREATERWLRKFLEQRTKVQRLVVYRYMRGTSQQLAEQIQASQEFCRRHEKSQRQWMRVLLIFDPVATWEWLQLESDLRRELEERSSAVVWLHPWDTTGLKQQLDQHGKMSSIESCQRVLEQTGGWPWLLDRLRDKWTEGNDDPLEGVETLRKGLENDEGHLRSRFTSALGLVNEPSIQHVLKFVSEFEEPVPVELVTPDLMDGELTAAQCEAAVAYLQGLALLRVQDHGFEVESIARSILLG